MDIKIFVGVKLSLVTLFMATYTIESVAADCPSSISGNTTISSGCNLTSSGITIDAGATLSAGSSKLSDSTISGYIINNGTMNLTGAFALVINSSTVSEITNNGIVNLSGPYSIRLETGGTVTNFINNGSYSMGSNYAITNNGGTITNFSNAGSMHWTTGTYGFLFENGAIGTFTNTGTITGATSQDIRFSGGTFNTLNNQQGKAINDPLTMSAPPSNYNIIIASANDYGQIKFSGTGALNFGIYSTSVVDSTSYTAVLRGITAADLASNTGTFGSLDWQLVETSSGSKIWDLLFPTYTAVSVVDTVSVFGSTSNTRQTLASAAAAIIDANSVLLDKFADLNGDQEIANAAESTLPAIAGGVSQITNVAINAVTDVISARQDISRGLSSGDGFMTDRHIWFKPFGGWTEQDTRQGVNGYEVDSYGLAAGFDYDVSATWNVGFAFAYINSDVESNLAAGSHTIDIDSYQTKVYATKMLDDMTALNLQVGVGISDYDSTRSIFNGDVASADYDSWNVQLSAELERSYQVSDKTMVTPYIHADYGYVNVEDYNETGADALNLNVADDSSDSLIIGAGVKVNHRVSDSLLLMTNAGVGYDIMTDRSSLSSSFAGGGAQFNTEGIKPDEVVYNAGIGAEYSLDNGTEITVSYNIDAREGYTDQLVAANFRLMF